MPAPICPSFKASVGFPVYGLGFTASNQLIVAGGGGAGRSGVKNQLVSFRVETRRKALEDEAVLELSEKEDAPMCLDVHPKQNVVISGINSTNDKIKKGENENCRVFDIKETQLTLKKAVSTLSSRKVDDYQKVIRFNEAGNLLVTGATNGDLHVLKYPEMTPSCDTADIGKEEIVDADISPESDKVVCALSKSLKLVSLRGRNAGQVLQTISVKSFDASKKLEFRAFRYGRGYSKDSAFVVLNRLDRPEGYLCRTNAFTLEKEKMIRITKSPITAFCISRDGGILGVGSADLSLTILEAATLRVLTTIKDAHSFAITSISISPDRRLLVSGSADHTCCVVSMPLQFPPAASMINPVYTIMAVILLGALLVWITSSFQVEDPSQLALQTPTSQINTATRTQQQTGFVETNVASPTVFDDSISIETIIPSVTKDEL